MRDAGYAHRRSEGRARSDQQLISIANRQASKQKREGEENRGRRYGKWSLGPPSSSRRGGGHVKRSHQLVDSRLHHAVVISGLHLPPPVHAHSRLLGRILIQRRRRPGKGWKNCWCLSHLSFLLTLPGQCRGAASCHVATPSEKSPEVNARRHTHPPPCLVTITHPPAPLPYGHKSLRPACFHAQQARIFWPACVDL